jgi:hypothetical protein
MYVVDTPAEESVCEILLSEIEIGMVFAGDVVTSTGLLLIARGQEVTPSLVGRVRSHWQAMASVETVRMIAPVGRDMAPRVTPTPCAA